MIILPFVILDKMRKEDIQKSFCDYMITLMRKLPVQKFSVICDYPVMYKCFYFVKDVKEQVVNKVVRDVKEQVVNKVVRDVKEQVVNKVVRDVKEKGEF